MSKISDLEAKAKNIKPTIKSNKTDPGVKSVTDKSKKNVNDRVTKTVTKRVSKPKYINVKQFTTGQSHSFVKPHTVNTLRIKEKDTFELAVESLLRGGDVSAELAKNDYKKLFSYLHVTNNKLLEGKVINALAKKTKMGKTILNQAMKQYAEKASELEKEKKQLQALTTYKKVFKELDNDNIELPHGYFIDGDYLTYANQPICKVFTVSNRVIIDDDEDRAYFQIKKVRGRNEKKFLVPATILTNNQRVAELFANTGELLDGYKAKMVTSFISEYTRINEDEIKDSLGRKTVGWLDGTYYLPQFKQDVIWIEEHRLLQKRFTTKGTVENQIIMMQELAKGKAFITTLASLSSSLYGLIDNIHMNFVLHVGGTNGDGKSLAIKSAVSLYGRPNSDYKLGWDNTSTAVEVYLESMHHAPAWLDDTEEQDSLSFITRTLYNFANGAGRGRARIDRDNDIRLRKMSLYEGVLFSSGEKSIKNIVELEAGNGVIKKQGIYRRVIDLRASDLWDNIDKSKVGKLFDNNYGNFIEVWTELLKKEVKYIEDRYLDLDASDTPNLNGKEQIYHLFIIVLELLHKYSYIDKDALNLQKNNIWAMMKEEHALMIETKDIVTQFKIKFSNFIAENPHKFLTPTKVDVGNTELIGAITLNEIKFSTKVFESFCSKEGIPYTILIDALKKQGHFLLSTSQKHYRTIRLKETSTQGVVFKRNFFDFQDGEDFNTLIN